MINYLNNFNFAKIINNSGTSVFTKPCMDQVCGYIDMNGKYHSLRTRHRNFNVDYYSTNTSRCIGKIIKSPIVIILESPHKYEFDPQGNPIGPAQYKTGKYFDEYFEELLEKSCIYNALSGRKHAVVFVNAVQYQCSLGKALSGYKNKKNREIRDKNWEQCFINGGCRTDLICRVNALNPAAVINLCTSNLRGYIDGLFYNNANYTSGNHPSSWYCKRNRKIK